MTPEKKATVEKPRQLFVCQKCGEEIDAGELDHNGRHAYCGGHPDPNGETDD